ncbi:hypothetical protein [Burkholderia catarinensis]|uniref:hypothetical protein n=1 Tax=Burkholderia catarinensis TaxID=1108140 RepID=UPI0010085DCD|nr:hypothetical protein [Burkholderia catarinensis]
MRIENGDARAIAKGRVRDAAHDGPRGIRVERVERVPVRGEGFKPVVHDCPCCFASVVDRCIVDAYPVTRMLSD